MSKSQLILLAALVVSVILVILLWKKKKNTSPPKLTARFDKLEECQDTCFEKYPFAWQNEKRQKECMTPCISDTMQAGKQH